MAKQKETEIKAAPDTAALEVKTSTETSVASEFPVSIDEFCSRLSAADKRVEMIGAFHHIEQAAGRIKDTESAYRIRFAEFCTMPV